MNSSNSEGCNLIVLDCILCTIFIISSTSSLFGGLILGITASVLLIYLMMIPVLGLIIQILFGIFWGVVAFDIINFFSKMEGITAILVCAICAILGVILHLGSHLALGGKIEDLLPAKSYSARNDKVITVSQVESFRKRYADALKSESDFSFTCLKLNNELDYHDVWPEYEFYRNNSNSDYIINRINELDKQCNASKKEKERYVLFYEADSLLNVLINNQSIFRDILSHHIYNKKFLDLNIKIYAEDIEIKDKVKKYIEQLHIVDLTKDYMEYCKRKEQFMNEIANLHYQYDMSKDVLTKLRKIKETLSIAEQLTELQNEFNTTLGIYYNERNIYRDSYNAHHKNKDDNVFEKFSSDDMYEYSCAVKPHVRSDGNRQSGTRKPLSASLLA